MVVTEKGTPVQAEKVGLENYGQSTPREAWNQMVKRQKATANATPR